MRSSWGLGVSVALAVVCGALQAHAASPQAQALIKDGERLYKENRYLEAAQALKQAWALEPNPTLLYNIARALDQAGELKAALDGYRDFVGTPEADPALVKKANLAMDRLRTLVARNEADQKLQDAEKKRLEEEARRERARAEAEADKARATREAFEARERAALEGAASRGSGRRTAAFVLGGASLASFAVGIGVGLAANGSRSAFSLATTVDDKRRLEGETRARALVADLALVLGVASAVTAALVFPWSAGASVALAPTPGGATVGVGGSF